MRRVSLVLFMVSVLGFGCSEDRSLARVKLYGDTLLTREMVTITLDDGQSKWRFGSSSLRSYQGAWSTPEVKTRSEGSILVTYQFRDPEGTVVSTGHVVLDLRADWRWGIDIFHRDENPYRMCMGCFGYESFPILDPAYRVSESDSIFVIWGGNSISNPVDY